MENILRQTAIIVLALASLIASTTCEAGKLYVFTVIDGPSPGEGGEYTLVQAISDSHLIVGFAFPNDPCTYSFMFDGVTFTGINVPISGFICVDAEGVNNSGEVVGDYGSGGVRNTGFLLNGTTFTSIEVPTGLAFPATLARGINDKGQIAGYYYTYDPTAAAHGFVYSRGAFSFYDVPGAIDTLTEDISNSGELVGSYLDSFGYHGFLSSNSGTIAIDVPGAVSTCARGINDKGTVVGSYTAATASASCDIPEISGSHGFIYDDGSFNFVDVPGAFSTQLTGINNRGQIVGSYLLGQYHGVLADPVTSMEIMPQSVNDKISIQGLWITVKIHSNLKFNAPMLVNSGSLTFGRTGTEQSLVGCGPQSDDSNADGFQALICAFDTGKSAFQCGDTVGVLEGNLIDGRAISATDRITVGPCN